MFNKKALLAAAILLGTAGGLVACGGEKENPFFKQYQYIGATRALHELYVYKG